MNNSQSSPKLFFSYGHDDNKEIVNKLKDDLQKNGYKVWMDYNGIGTWEDWRGKITEAILNHDLAIVYLSEHSTRDSADNVCLNEIALVLDKPMKIKPILTESMGKVKPPITISHIQFLDISKWIEIKNGKVKDVDFNKWYEEKLAEIIKGIEKDKEFSGDIEVLKKILKPLPFKSDIFRHIKYFTGRKWVFNKYYGWLKDIDSRLLWITAGPGFGKTAVAANLVNNHPDAIIGALFCQRGLSDPVEALMTISFQIAYRLEDYRAKLMESLGILNISENISIESIKIIRDELVKMGEKSLYKLFCKLLQEPLQDLIGNTKKYVVVIDALDEISDKEGNNPIAELIAHEFTELSENLSFIVTSRPDPSVVSQMQGYNPFRIDSASFKEDNIKDLARYIENSLKKLIEKGKINSLSNEEFKEITGIFIKKSEGMMLYLKLVFEDFKKGSLDLNSLRQIPKGLYALYVSQFDKKFGNEQYKKFISPLLRIIIASLGPIPEELLYQILKCQITEYNKEKFYESVNILGSYIVSSDEGLKVFHKSLADWLTTNTKDSPNNYFIDYEYGMTNIAEYLLEDFKRGSQDNFYQEIRWLKQVKEWLPILIKNLPYVWDSEYILLNDFGSFLAINFNNNAALNIFNRAIWILEGFKKNLGERFTKDMAYSLARIYMNKGNSLRQLGNNNNAVIEFEKAIKIWEVQKEIGERFTPDILDNLAGAHMIKGDALAVMGNNNDAVMEFEKAILISEELRKNLKEGFTAFMANNLAKAYTNKGNAFQVMGNNNDAVMEFEKAIEIWENLKKELEDEFEPNIEQNLAKTYNNNAIAFRNTGENEKALFEYEKAIRIWEKLTKELKNGFTPYMSNNLAKTYSNKGVAFCSIGENEKALFEYEKAIEIWEKLNIKLIERVTPGMSNGLAIALTNKGTGFCKIGKIYNAVTEFEKAITIWGEVQNILGNKFNPYMSNNLAKTIANKGVAFRNNGEYEKAIIEFEKAIRISEKLRNELEDRFVPDMANCLATTYKNYKMTLKARSDNYGTVIDYNKADEILEKLRKKLSYEFYKTSEELFLLENELLSGIDK